MRGKWVYIIEREVFIQISWEMGFKLAREIFQGQYNKLGIREVKKDNFKLTRMRERKSRDLDRVRDV